MGPWRFARRSSCLMLEVSSSQSQSFSHNIKELLTVVIMGLDLICSQFLSTLFCYEKQLSLVLLLYCTSFWRGWNILLYLSGICCITISGTATGISSCISCTCLEYAVQLSLVLLLEYPPVSLVPVWNV